MVADCIAGGRCLTLGGWRSGLDTARVAGLGGPGASNCKRNEGTSGSFK